MLFEAYIQFSEYISFVRAMDGLRNMKLVKRMDDDNLFETSIQVGMVYFLNDFLFFSSILGR